MTASARLSWNLRVTPEDQALIDRALSASGLTRTDFDCGDASLNRWLQQRALANQGSGATRTFVVCDGAGMVKAYVALASGAVAVAASPGRFLRNMLDPIPVVVLARLAVDRSVQGQALARALLADAFTRVAQASEQIGVRGILVHAASPAATAFYLRMGFEASPLDSTTLMVRLSDLGEVLGRRFI